MKPVFQETKEKEACQFFLRTCPERWKKIGVHVCSRNMLARCWHLSCLWAIAFPNTVNEGMQIILYTGNSRMGAVTRYPQVKNTKSRLEHLSVNTHSASQLPLYETQG